MTVANQTRQQRLRELLHESRQEVWAKIHGDIFANLSQDYRAELDRGMDSADMSILDVLQTVGVRLIDIRSAELTQMAEAERKLNEGTYGICERCGREIGEKRLKAIPYATHCLECAEEVEGETIQGKGSPTM